MHILELHKFIIVILRPAGARVPTLIPTVANILKNQDN